MGEETVRERQSRVSRSGGEWEEYVRLFLEERKECNIDIVYGKSESRVKERSMRLWRLLSTPLRSTVKDRIWGDIDLIVVKGVIPVAIISCKESLHGRFTETLFWSLTFRTTSRIKVVLATPDKGRGEKRWSSEWGTLDNPSKDRLLGETYLDGIYVDNVEGFCEAKRQDKATVLGGVVRALKELPSDLCRWSKDTKFLEDFIYGWSRDTTLLEDFI